MFLFQIYYTKRKRRIPIESNTKIAGEGCEVNFYRSLIRRGTEFQTLSITEHWHNELGNYYRFQDLIDMNQLRLECHHNHYQEWKKICQGNRQCLENH